MGFIIDFLLLAASGAACFYCWVLSSRIKSVTDTKDGIHSGIVALTRSAEEIQTAIASTKDSAAENAATLEQLLSEADKKIPELRDLMQQLTEISRTAVSETESATKNLVDTLSPHVKEAQEISYQLLDALEASYAANAGPSAGPYNPEPALSDGEIEVSLVADDDLAANGEAA